jgi:hypothetical protein
VSLQVAILKVLASYPDGRATLAEMKADLAILAGAGPEWNARLKRLSDRIPGLDIFGKGLVLRDASGWVLTSAGRDALLLMEQQAASEPEGVLTPFVPGRSPPKLQLVACRPARGPHVRPISNVVDIAERRSLRRARTNEIHRPAS